MNEVIKSITEAEAKAAEIKADALQKAAEIAATAEMRAEEISRKCETDCKLFRENQLKKAERDAEANYEKEISEKSGKAKAYADLLITKTDGTVNEIVRRITRGSC
ncbi:MAG: hypothetical protein K2O89_07365 [Clostridia bacterium]|nr:hypothetical protein [Clostridia bacterium]